MDSRIDQEILTQEEGLTHATRHVDVEALDRIYADDIMFTGVTGVVCTKAMVMDEARRGLTERREAAAVAAAVVSYQKDDIKVVAHGETAVTSYRFDVTIRHEGRDNVRKFRTMNVWMKRNGRWQVIAAHTASLS